jgi:SH3-like domain-containing protein
MTIRRVGRVVVFMIAGVAWGVSETPIEVQVLGDRVNLRARPAAEAEVVAQASEGDRLTATRVEGDWAGVLAPTNAAVWIKGQFVKDGVIQGERINLRSGPGVSFRPLGVVDKGARVAVMETRGDWVRVTPPANLVVWVNRALVEGVPGVAAAGAASVAGGAAPDQALGEAPVTGPALARELPAGLTRDDLAAVLGQGAMMSRTGTVERVPLAFFRGVDFRLVDMRDGSRMTVCFLKGNDEQMPSLAGRRFSVTGREYWLKSARRPVLYLETLKPEAE